MVMPAYPIKAEQIDKEVFQQALAELDLRLPKEICINLFTTLKGEINGWLLPNRERY